MGSAALFVYGTLRPGELRWPLLEPFAVDHGWDDAVVGQLYDTGYGYPGATFGHPGRPDAPTSDVIGRTVPLLTTSLARALEVLDRVEDTAEGLYRRIRVTTRTGIDAWAYEWTDPTGSVPIPSGDWCQR